MAAYSDPPTPTKFQDMMKEGRAASFYHRNAINRQVYLDRARECAEVTIPSLFRMEGAGETDDLVIPWNSIGAYGVNNLASKVVFALFPPGRPNFKAEQDRRSKNDLLLLPPEERTPIEQAIRIGLSQMEQDVAAAIETDGDRAKMFTAALRLIIGGNHCFQFYPEDATIRGIPLERYVLVRDPMGNELEWAIEDILEWDTLPEDVRNAIRNKANMGMDENPPPLTGRGERPFKVYTHGRLTQGKWEVHQAVCGIVVPGSEATLSPEALNFMFPVWILLEGENYGRSYVEFFEGDLLTVESLTKTIGEGSAEIAKLIRLVNPTGMTDKKQLAKAQNGDVLSGREQDVYTLTAEGKSVDFSVASQEAEKALTRLAKAFLLNSSIQRAGERVTAEEIRYVAQELEDALGGVYSQQIVTWQAPYIKRKIKYLKRANRIAKVPDNAVSITVTAGLASLARNAELEGLRQFAAVASEMFGPEAMAGAIDQGEALSRIAAALGVNPEGLVLTEEQKAEATQQMQMMEMMKSLGPEGLRQAGSYVTGNAIAQTNAEAKIATSQPQPSQP